MAYDPLFGNNINDCFESDDDDLHARMEHADNARRAEEARQRAAEWAAAEFSGPIRSLEDQAPADLRFAA